MKMIVAADRNWAIGKENHLLVSIPADQKWFRRETEGKVVVMGRKTLETLPGGLPLKKRRNLILTHRKDLRLPGAEIFSAPEELLLRLKEFSSDQVYCIGGESIYRLLLPYADTALVTRINFAYDADRYFPDLDQLPEWTIREESEEQTYFDLEYRFVRYERTMKPQKPGLL